MSNHSTRDRLLLTARTFADARGLSLARVGTLVANDGKFFTRLAAGRDCTTGMFDKTLRWFAEQWPAELPWPEGVERPSIVEAA
jgi:hypothetical protein